MHKNINMNYPDSTSTVCETCVWQEEHVQFSGVLSQTLASIPWFFFFWGQGGVLFIFCRSCCDSPGQSLKHADQFHGFVFLLLLRHSIHGVWLLLFYNSGYGINADEAEVRNTGESTGSTNQLLA